MSPHHSRPPGLLRFHPATDGPNSSQPRWIGFAFSSPILGRVGNLPTTGVCDYTVRCKGCGENIPAPVHTMPDTWIVADCPLCGARRRYLPPDYLSWTLVVSARQETCALAAGGSAVGLMRRAVARDEQEGRKQDRRVAQVPPCSLRHGMGCPRSLCWDLGG